MHIDFNPHPKMTAYKDGRSFPVMIKAGSEALLGGRSEFPMNTVFAVIDARSELQGADQSTIVFRELKESPHLYEVTYRREKFDGTYQILLDRTKQWAMVEKKTTAADGKVLSSEKTALKEVPGIGWIPDVRTTLFPHERVSSGVVPHNNKLMTITTPAGSNKRAVLEAKINDPEFDETVFKIVIPPGARVWDARHKAQYSVRSAIGREEVDQAGQQAQERQAKSKRP